MSRKSVRFSFASEEERLEFETYARSSGMTLSSMAKAAFYRFVKAERERERYNAERRTGRPNGRPRETARLLVESSK